MTVPVYLAGPSTELPRVTRYAEKLEASGLVHVTCRWWEDVLANGVGADAEMSWRDQTRRAMRDRRGVCAASILWCLWPNQTSHGAAWECGYADARCAIGTSPTHIVITGPRSHECIFTSLVFRDSSDDIGLVEVLRAASEIGRRR